MRRVVVALLALAASHARGADLHVDGGLGSDASDGLSWSSAKRTVTAALDAALATPEADTVSVAEGTYLERLVVPPGVTLLAGFLSGGGVADPAAHPTILDGELGGTVVSFGSGTDDCVLDGFTVRHGQWRGPGDRGGGGITVVDASPTIRRCVIERNVGRIGGGIFVLRGAPWIIDCVIRDNRSSATGAALGVLARPGVLGIPHLLRTVIEDNVGGEAAYRGRGGVIHVSADGQSGWLTEPVPLLDGCLVRRNSSLSRPPHVPGIPSSVVLYVETLGRFLSIRDTAFRGNAMVDVGIKGGAGRPERTEFFNCEFSDLRRAANASVCQSAPAFTNCTFAGSGALVQSEETAGFTTTLVYLSRCVVSCPLRLRDPRCYVNDMVVSDSLIVGGLPQGTNVVDADPMFTSGPDGGYYLSQVAAGQAADSPALDQGPPLASDLGLDTLGTRTDGAGDAGPVDWGVHYGPTFGGALPSSGVPADAMEIVRGANPIDLESIAVIPDLPYTDAPGVLSDPGLPLLFYRAQWAGLPIRVAKDEAGDTVRLTY